MAKILLKSLGYFFYKKLPNAIKNRPNGEISPNLVTLSGSDRQTSILPYAINYDRKKVWKNKNKKYFQNHFKMLLP
jgi:hypothetical protein